MHVRVKHALVDQYFHPGLIVKIPDDKSVFTISSLPYAPSPEEGRTPGIHTVDDFDGSILMDFHFCAVPRDKDVVNDV